MTNREAYPAEVSSFHDALMRLRGVVSADTGINALANYSPDTYRFPGEFGDLPHSLLRRTNGGLPNEAWAKTELVLSRDTHGWVSLEFLAWWVRDQSRGGEDIQLRALALPPEGFTTQLGATLKFVIDHFALCPGSPTPMLLLFAERAVSLNICLNLYRGALGETLRNPGGT